MLCGAVLSRGNGARAHLLWVSLPSASSADYRPAGDRHALTPPCQHNNHHLRLTTTFTLQPTGNEITANLSSATEALTIVNRKPYSIIIVDFTGLPELYRAYRKDTECQTSPCVMLASSFSLCFANNRLLNRPVRRQTF